MKSIRIHKHGGPDVLEINNIPEPEGESAETEVVTPEVETPAS